MERLVNVQKVLFIALTDSLMRDKEFLIQTAETCNFAYYKATSQPQTPLFSDIERAVLLLGDSKEVITTKGIKKLATNTAGFFAVQEAVFEFANENNCEPIDVLENIVGEDSDPKILSKAMRYAHATWLTSNAHRNGTTRAIVKPFDQLTEEEKSFDKVQIKTSAQMWLEAIKQNLN